MTLTDLCEHLRDMVKVDGKFSTIEDGAAIPIGRVAAFATGKTHEPRLEFLAKLLVYFYPNYQFILGEASPPMFVPPEGWLQHPQNSLYYYNVQTREVILGTELRRRPAVKLAAALAKIVAPQRAAE